MVTLEQYDKRLRSLRQQHAWEAVTNPQMGNRPAGEAYSYAIGFQSGLQRAEKLIRELLDEDQKGNQTL